MLKKLHFIKKVVKKIFISSISEYNSKKLEMLT